MKYAVVFESRTGNTAKLAEHIKSLISPENLVFLESLHLTRRRLI